MRGIHRRPTYSGKRGIVLDHKTGKWRASLRGRVLGLFSTIEQAVRAQDKARQ